MEKSMQTSIQTNTQQNTKMITWPYVNRMHKDTIFRRIFSEKKNLLELYNALNNSHYDNPDDLTINTLEDAIYMNVKNDLSFIFHSYLSLYEHQSTINPNIPLRDLDYINRLLRGLTVNNNLYGRKPVLVPAPQFIVFYNGTDPMPDRSEWKLSDLYEIRQEEPALELKVTVLNINAGHNPGLMKMSKTLSDYAVFTQKTRNGIIGATTDEEKYEAVSRVVDECIREDILADFLRKNREEAIGMSLFEYDEEKHMKCVREEGWEDGYAKGCEAGLQQGREEGREEGWKEGREEGQKQGQKQGQLQVLTSLIERGILTIEEAAGVVGLPVEELKSASSK